MDFRVGAKASLDVVTKVSTYIIRVSIRGVLGVLKGSWDLVIKVSIKVTVLIITYNLNQGTYNHTY